MISDIVLSIVLIVLSLVWAYIGIFDLGLWVPGVSADSGFIPTVFSVVTLICAVILLIQALKKRASGQASSPKQGEEAAGEQKKLLAIVKKYSVILFGAFGALALQFLGLTPMCFLLIFGWLKLINNFSWVKSIAISAVVTVAIYLVFVVWLQIPFPGLI